MEQRKAADLRRADDGQITVDEAERAAHQRPGSDVGDEGVTASTCRARPSTTLVRSRPSTMSFAALLSGFTTRILPAYRFVSTTQTPVGPTAMWSMVARLCGIRRSWRTRTPSPRRFASASATSSSAPAPCAHRRSGASPSAASRPPMCGWRRRTASSRRTLRRSCSRRALAPGVPGVAGLRHAFGRAGPTLAFRHVTVGKHRIRSRAQESHVLAGARRNRGGRRCGERGAYASPPSSAWSGCSWRSSQTGRWRTKSPSARR
jgi:hypothetical protein